jgi:hypothetical protein
MYIKSPGQHRTKSPSSPFYSPIRQLLLFRLWRLLLNVLNNGISQLVSLVLLSAVFAPCRSAACNYTVVYGTSKWIWWYVRAV